MKQHKYIEINLGKYPKDIYIWNIIFDINKNDVYYLLNYYLKKLYFLLN